MALNGIRRAFQDPEVKATLTRLGSHAKFTAMFGLGWSFTSYLVGEEKYFAWVYPFYRYTSFGVYRDDSSGKDDGLDNPTEQKQV